MDRRRFLGAVAGTSAFAGCTGSDKSGDTTRQDSDGDGVADSEDYAPSDPDVQSKSDLDAATTRTATTTTTTTRTTTTEPTEMTTRRTTTTTTESADANVLTVDDGWSEQESHVSAYSSQSVTAHVAPDGPDVAGTFDGRSAKLLAFAYEFPRGDAVTYATSDPVTIDGPTTLTASPDLSDADLDSGTPVHYMAFLAPGDLDVEEMSAEDLAFFHETDPFVLRDDGTIERYSHTKALSDASDDGYERNAVEGAYSLSFEGSTQGQSWAVSFYIYKSSYVQAVEEPRGRSRPEYVAHAQQEGFADELAGILADEAEANGFSGKRTQVEFVIDFVQNLPYVSDDASKGYDDYTKFITETITEASGDCEDTSIMLAAVLQADPFGYDTVLIQPPEHMAVGVYGSDDLPGYYWTYEGRNYYYIETTGTGWGIGDVPETYQDADAYVYQV